LRQSQRQPVILEGELPGGTQKTRAGATGCPGVAASSPILLLGADRAAGQPRGLSIRDREVTNPRTGFGKCGTRHFFERCRAEAVIPPIGDKATQETTYECGSGGWPGPHLFVPYFSLHLIFVFCSPTLRNIEQRCTRRPSFFGLA
jgi:hypothetical protein